MHAHCAKVGRNYRRNIMRTRVKSMAHTAGPSRLYFSFLTTPLSHAHHLSSAALQPQCNAPHHSPHFSSRPAQGSTVAFRAVKVQGSNRGGLSLEGMATVWKIHTCSAGSPTGLSVVPPCTEALYERCQGWPAAPGASSMCDAAL